MGHHVMLLALSLLAVTTVDPSPSCSIERCYCVSNPSWAYIFLNCYVSSITPSDATITALSIDITFVILNCDSFKSPSILSDGIFDKFNQLSTLWINDCNITVLEANAFRGLFALTNLTILRSMIPELDPKTFSHLSGLVHLLIGYSNLTSLPDISHLKLLQYFNVSYNNLQNIGLESLDRDLEQADYFNQLFTIDISYNNISSIPLSLIVRAPHLRVLVIMGLPLTELILPKSLQLRDLFVLDATNSALAVVDISGLGTYTKLAALRLEGTGRPLSFSGMPQLDSLIDLYLNNFAINDSIWQQLNSSLQASVILTNNHLTTIDISHLLSLQELNLTGNRISLLNAGALTDGKQNISTELPASIFVKNNNIIFLHLSDNNISVVPTGAFQGLNKLEWLDLSNNLISALPIEAFKDVPSMQILYLRNNKLESLPQLSYMPQLGILDIGFNHLTSISPHDLAGLVQLNALFVNNNRLTVLPNNIFSQNPNVAVALFQHNQITRIGTFGAHPSLRGLQLDNNQIVDFISESPFVRLQKLDHLKLDVNNLTRVNDYMFPLSVQVLNLAENNFESLTYTSFNYLPYLTEISISKNKRNLFMPSVAVNVFKNHSPKPTFNVGGNNFVCDCNMSYLKVILEGNYSSAPFNNPYPLFIGVDNSTCSTPIEGGAIRPFMDVPLSHFACEYNVTWCDDICRCCSDAPKCECALSCPIECKCYYGGSGLKKFYIHIHCRSQNLEQIPNGIPARTVVLYLDGNNLGHLSKQDFAHLQDAEDIYLNSSYIKSTDNGTFENISALKSLSLNDNQLTSIDDNFLGRLPSVKQIYLHNNLIDTISSEAFFQLSSVETITLHNNRLMFLKAVLKIPHPMSMTLSGNPWSCNCDVSKVLMRTFYEIKASIADNEELCCSFQESSFLSKPDSRGRTLSLTKRNGTITVLSTAKTMEDKPRLFSSEDYNSTNPSSSCLPLTDFSYQDYCRSASNSTVSRSTSSPGFHPGFIALIVITIIVLLVAVAVVTVLLKRQEVQAIVFAKLGIRILDKTVHLDKGDADQKVFDAFVSYSDQDEAFVLRSLLPMLENNNYHLCVQFRDFPVGRDLTETIYRAIQNSSRTILLLSMNFLSSEWCRFEFQTAHHHVLREGSHRLIVVILGDVPEEEMDPDLKVHIQSRTYLKYGDRWFWEKLFFAMPSIKGRQVNNGDQRADILQRMQVLAQDEIVDREINLPGQQHNVQDEIVD